MGFKRANSIGTPGQVPSRLNEDQFLILEDELSKSGSGSTSLQLDGSEFGTWARRGELAAAGQVFAVDLYRVTTSSETDEQARVLAGYQETESGAVSANVITTKNFNNNTGNCEQMGGDVIASRTIIPYADPNDPNRRLSYLRFEGIATGFCGQPVNYKYKVLAQPK